MIGAKSKEKRYGMLRCGIVSAILFLGCLLFPLTAEAAKKHVVCIDAGHGGENTGAQYLGMDEKDLTLLIAQAMEEELSLYDDVEVVMTRREDTELSLAQRAEIGARGGAEFLFSIHLNASEHHTAYGTEIWVPSEGRYYASSRAFGEIAAEEICAALGTYNRGVKTKRSFKKAGEYYGILKNSVKQNMNAAIIEHCHMDEIHDKDAFLGEGRLQQMGRADATAAAKYLGLKSDILGVDYSSRKLPGIKIPKAPVWQDTTPPEEVSVSLVGLKKEAGYALLQGKALDSESEVLYYSISKDGGNTWSHLKKWTADKPCTILVSITDGDRDIRVRFWNRYDLWTESEPVKLIG